MVNITNFTVVLLEDPRHQDTFQLTDDTRGEMTHSESVLLVVRSSNAEIYWTSAGLSLRF